MLMLRTVALCCVLLAALVTFGQNAQAKGNHCPKRTGVVQARKTALVKYEFVRTRQRDGSFRSASYVCFRPTGRVTRLDPYVEQSATLKAVAGRFVVINFFDSDRDSATVRTASSMRGLGGSSMGRWRSTPHVACTRRPTACGQPT
jgi:hypothetical protein